MAKTNNPAEPADIESLRERYGRLALDRAKAEERASTAAAALDAAKAKAKADHGTDDLDRLRALLAERVAANQKLRAEYQAHLDKIDADLKAIEATGA